MTSNWESGLLGPVSVLISAFLWPVFPPLQSGKVFLAATSSLTKHLTLPLSQETVRNN